MPKNNIIKFALANAILTAFYVDLVGIFMSHTNDIFGGVQKTAFIPIAMLLLFVFSAALCGALMLGRPVLWYLDGRKAEALKLFVYSLVSFFVIMLVFFLALYFVGM